MNSFKREFNKIAEELKGKDRKTVYKDLAAGSLAGLSASLVTHPINTLQNKVQNDPKKYPTIRAAASEYYHGGVESALKGESISLGAKKFPKLVNNLNKFIQARPALGGAKAFYAGAGLKSMNALLMSGISFPVYEALKHKFNKGNKNAETSSNR